MLICITINGHAQENNNVKFSGETNYNQSSSNQLTTTVRAAFKLKVYEPVHKNWGLFLAGNVSPDYDVFQKIVKINVFNSVVIEF